MCHSCFLRIDIHCRACRMEYPSASSHATTEHLPAYTAVRGTVDGLAETVLLPCSNFLVLATALGCYFAYLPAAMYSRCTALRLLMLKLTSCLKEKFDAVMMRCSASAARCAAAVLAIRQTKAQV
ncbi:hypothetical protein NPIL_414361 [Nephila pilipes]|uniref:Uncharacterized protein n=1 Tax=Nephila pilipes TaxID=299642 RepID=A0A8X6TIB8_NEPPI|nr:hypothetical protein NPIL_414361 [Nephila pilipes]